MPEEFGRYVLQDLLGRGGMGEVYRALDTVRERTVALKLLSKHLGEDESFKVRFRRESRMVAKLNQPHIIPIHDFGEIDGQLFIDMRLVEGDDLGTVLEREGPMAPERGVGVIAQVASALDAAHRAGLVHRDVKPSNVLLTDLSDDLSGDLFAYLVDFGIAFSFVAPATALTATASTVGTVAYMSPERIGGQTSDRSTDIYALACVLYESLTGQKPFDGELLAMMYAHVNTAPPKVTALVPDAPPGLDEVVSKGMAKDPKDRYATAGELARAARAALRHPTAPSPPLPTAHETTLPVGPATGTTMPLRAGPPTPTPPPRYLSGPPTPPPAYLSGNAFGGAGSSKGTHRRRAMIAALCTLFLVSAVVVAVLVSRHPGTGNSPGQSRGNPLGQPTAPSGQLAFGESMEFPRNLMSVSYAG
ncbi:MAG: serine/threonine-protein kinase, partial [Pseudonocardiales bacterium]